MEDRLEKYIQAIEGALVKGTVHEVQLEEALQSRDVIARAKGILMERKGHLCVGERCRLAQCPRVR